MTITPVDNNFKVERGFAKSTPQAEPVIDVVEETAEEILLLGFMGGIRRIMDECRALQAEHDVLVGDITPEELVEAMTEIDASFSKCEVDLEDAKDILDNLLTEDKFDGNETTPQQEA